MKSVKDQDGFSYIETIISITIITIGLLGALSALTWGIIYINEAGKKTEAKQIANSVIESIFAVRDINTNDPLVTLKISGWSSIQNKVGTNTGIFAVGTFPVRTGPGADGIYGTVDDSCAAGSSCGGNPEVPGFTRNVQINDIVENNVVRKRSLVVTISYPVGPVVRSETISTIIANLPFSNN